VRTSVAGFLVAVCLGLAGCGTTGKKQPQADPGPRPVPSGGVAAPVFPSGDRASAPASGGVDGILAGQVVDRYNRRQPGAKIEIVDLQKEGKTAAPIEYSSDNQGYFVIQGLQPGRHYKLIARGKDGSREVIGTTFAAPPNARLSIYVSEDYTPAPAQPAGPKGDKSPGTADPPPKQKSDAGAEGGTPGTKTQADTGTGTAPSSAIGGNPPPEPQPRLDKMVDKGGFQSAPPSVNINGPRGPGADPTPRHDSGPPAGSLILPPTPAPGRSSSQLPFGPTPVPSCVLEGNRLENFALSNLNGDPWEFRRDRRGRLVLLDFWYSTCGPCLHAIPHLSQLQRTYGPFGLEVVGIAYESGTREEQVKNVMAIRGRYGINYVTLLGGGPTCPVRKQFDVQRFPTTVLVDDKGRILWRAEGLDERSRWELETAIRRYFGWR
jgi:thiol-disulfide isomerase/thioredoxin